MQTIQKGFTLTELMIVLAIISILITFAIPAYQHYIARTQLAEALSLASGLKSTVIEQMGLTSKCPNNMGGSGVYGTTAGGIAKPSEISGKYVEKVEVSHMAYANNVIICTITATMRTQGVNSGIAGQNIGLVIYFAKDGWGMKTTYETTCLGYLIDKKYLPSSCVTLEEFFSGNN